MTRTLLASLALTLSTVASAETLDSFEGVDNTLCSSGGGSFFGYHTDAAIIGG